MKRLLLVALVCVASLGACWSLYRTLFADNSALTVKAANPGNSEVGVPVAAPVKVTFRKPVNPTTITSSTLRIVNSDDNIVATNVSYQPDSYTAILTPTAPLAYSATYRVVVAGGPTGIHDRRGKPLVGDLSWSFTTAAPPSPPPTEGPGGPILVLASSLNPFSRYYAEVLRNEGFNEFAVLDISLLAPDTLNEYDIVILGEFPLDDQQRETLANWVRDGGNLIAMRPDKHLADEIGLKDTGAVLHNGYLAIDTLQSPGTGLAKDTLQFHGPADLYEANGSTDLVALYKNATVAAGSPAVALRQLGSGFLAVFAYDLARSVVYTRQGNPDWQATERDGIAPIRSDDLFYGAAASDPQPDWVDLSKVAIPQADIQQRFLANLILYMNYRKKPLPRFWYFPNGYKAVVIMTGDDHGHGGTLGRLLALWAKDPPNCSLANWQCVRATSHIYPRTIKPEHAIELTNAGFEISLHLFTECRDWPYEAVLNANGTPGRRLSWQAADSLYSRQLAELSAAYPGLPAPRTSRVDCVTWGDYDTQPQVELNHGIRLDTNYYYWPPKWVGNRPGMFTGSGMPMRFAKLDGSLIDVYQATTQMTDESDQTYPFTIDSLLAKALGPEEYFGAFTANMHTDSPKSPGSDAIVASAQARGVPIISAEQMLTWLDGRNGSSFQKLTWNEHYLEFTVTVGAGGNGIQTLVPINSDAGVLDGIAIDGKPVNYEKRSFSGIEYAAFSSPPGRYRATYAPQRK